MSHIHESDSEQATTISATTYSGNAFAATYPQLPYGQTTYLIPSTVWQNHWVYLPVPSQSILSEEDRAWVRRIIQEEIQKIREEEEQAHAQEHRKNTAL